MTTTPRKPMHSCLVILLCGAGGILLALITAWGIAAYTKEPPELPARLPPPPAKAQVILGGTSYSFYDYALYIRAEDGLMYKYQTQEWSHTAPPEIFNDTDCQAGEIQLIETTVGKIKDCKQIQIIGEWCGGGPVDYAITAEGDLWSLDLAQQTCTNALITIPLSIIFTLGGLALGVIIVILRWVVTLLMERHQEESAQSKK